MEGGVTSVSRATSTSHLPTVAHVSQQKNKKTYAEISFPQQLASVELAQSTAAATQTDNASANLELKAPNVTSVNLSPLTSPRPGANHAESASRI